MGFHHVALATRDAMANHDFYTRAMGFRLVKVEPGRTPEGGRAKHLFYDTGGGGMIAFWEIQDDNLPDDWSPAISTGLGLPEWANHLAWEAADLEDIKRHRERWLACGHDVVEIDHRWCVSIYTRDPNGIMVEWCTSTQELTDEDAREALTLLDDPEPEPKEPPSIQVHRAGPRENEGG